MLRDFIFSEVLAIIRKNCFKKKGKRSGEDAIVLAFNENYELKDFQVFGGSLNESF